MVAIMRSLCAVPAWESRWREKAGAALSCLGHRPIAKRLHAGALQGTLWIDRVVGEAGRQAEFERSHQPACGKIMRDVPFGADDDALAGKRPFADHSPVVARQDGINTHDLLPRAVERPERHVLVILANRETSMLREISR